MDVTEWRLFCCCVYGCVAGYMWANIFVDERHAHAVFLPVFLACYFVHTVNTSASMWVLWVYWGWQGATVRDRAVLLTNVVVTLWWITDFATGTSFCHVSMLAAVCYSAVVGVVLDGVLVVVEQN